MKDTLTYYKELKEIIDTEDMDKLMAYLKAIPKEDLESASKALEVNSNTSLYSYLYTPIRVGINEWKEQSNTKKNLYYLACLATFNKKNFLGFLQPSQFIARGNYYSWTLDRTYENEFIEIILHRRISWLENWLLRTRIDHITLHKLYSTNYLEFNREISCFSLANVPESYSNAYLYIKNNILLLEKEIYLLFEIETHLYHAGKFQPEKPNWQMIFQKLVEDNVLEKKIILKKCIEASKRNFKANLLGWYRELFIKLNPTIEEKLALQHELFELFNQPLAANVNFAIDQIKNITEQKGFDIEAFLLNTESILPRNDLKGGIKSILSIYEKTAKKQPNFAAQICILTTNCLISAESSIQEKAAKIIKTYGDTNNEMLLASIEIYAKQLNRTTLEYLQDFISVDNKSNTSSEGFDYQYISQNFPKSTEGKPVEYISNWNDLLFQVGKALKSTDPIDAELLFDGIIRLQTQFPKNYKEQLEPYLKQLNNFSQNSYIGNIHRFIKEWGAVTPPTFYDYGGKTELSVKLFILQLKNINNKLKSKSSLPLLSTPTHAPFWVSCDVLVDRLLAYQNKNEAFDDVDFILAISRIAINPNSDIIQKIERLSNILKDLLLYLTTDNREIKLNKSSFIENTAQTITKYFSKLGNAIQLTTDDREALLWAVVARTKQSNGSFKEFEETTLKSLPNIVKPYKLDWKVVQWNEYISWNKKNIAHYRIKLNSINDRLEVNSSIYSLGYFGTKSPNDFIDIFADDIKYIYLLTPNFPEPFYFKVIQEYALESTTSSNLTKEAFHESLKTLLIYKPNIENSANLFLATGFLSNAPMNRDLSVEIFIQGVIEHRLDIKQLGQNIGKLLGGNYAPIQRLSDSLLSLKNISKLNDIALILFFENMLTEFSDELPKGFTKLLEFYNELLLNYNKEVSTEVEPKLSKWKENTSLMKQIIKMKKSFR